jgi:hypothetical protein
VFWIDKMKGIVLNTNLYFDPSEVSHVMFRLNLCEFPWSKNSGYEGIN